MKYCEGKIMETCNSFDMTFKYMYSNRRVTLLTKILETLDKFPFIKIDLIRQYPALMSFEMNLIEHKYWQIV